MSSCRATNANPGPLLSAAGYLGAMYPADTVRRIIYADFPFYLGEP